MRKYRSKPTEKFAMTFNEMVAHAKNLPDTHCVGGIPWSFKINGHAISHENDDEYIINTLEGNMKMNRDCMLIIELKGEIYPCDVEIFNNSYEEI